MSYVLPAEIVPSESLAYLATPYSKYALGIEAAFEAGCRLSGLLIRAGVKVYSPIAHGHSISLHGGIDPHDHSIWLPFDRAMMQRSDCLIVAHLDGWDVSVGIAEEVKFFELHSKPIWDLDPATLTMVKRKREAQA